MERSGNWRIVTNNPLVKACLSGRYEMDYADIPYRDILVKVRDLVYRGHRMYTHPLSGSIKPNETPYKSIVISKKPGKPENDGVLLISGSLETFDKFPSVKRRLPQQVLEDFRLIDYTLLCGAVGVDAAEGLRNRYHVQTEEGGVRFEIGTGLYPGQ